MKEKIYPAKTRPIKRRKTYYTDKAGNSLVKDTDGKFMVTNKQGKGVNQAGFVTFIKRKSVQDYTNKKYGFVLKATKKRS